MGRCFRINENMKLLQREYVLNRSVQICMKRGIVEIPLSGHMTDFDNAILLHSSDVYDINQIIKVTLLVDHI